MGGVGEDSWRVLGRFFEDPGRVLTRIPEGFWEGSGRDLAGFGEDSETVLGRFLDDSGRVLSRIPEGFWEGSGRNLGGFGEVSGERGRDSDGERFSLEINSYHSLKGGGLLALIY